MTTAKRSWVGMNFQEWCSIDENDERKINYTLHIGSRGFGKIPPETQRFTSEDYVDYITLLRVQDSYIESIELIDDEWYIELNYLC